MYIHPYNKKGGGGEQSKNTILLPHPQYSMTFNKVH